MGGGFRELTSLQTGSAQKLRGVPSEILYATTSGGALRQIVVPYERPGRARVHRLLSSGYQGVTELSWNGKVDLQSLIAIDPTGSRATWTTIKRASSRPKATLHGAVTGQDDWHLGAAF